MTRLERGGRRAVMYDILEPSEGSLWVVSQKVGSPGWARTSDILAKDDIPDQIKKLPELRQAAVISDDGFDNKKQPLPARL